MTDLLLTPAQYLQFCCWIWSLYWYHCQWLHRPEKLLADDLLRRSSIDRNLTSPDHLYHA